MVQGDCGSVMGICDINTFDKFVYGRGDEGIEKKIFGERSRSAVWKGWDC